MAKTSQIPAVSSVKTARSARNLRIVFMQVFMVFLFRRGGRVGADICPGWSGLPGGWAGSIYLDYSP